MSNQQALFLAAASAVGLYFIGAAYALDGGHSPVASDGAPVTLRLAAADATAPRGIAAFAGSDVAFDALSAASAPAALSDRVLPMVGSTPESVIGPDGRTKITNTTVFPYRAIVQITRLDGSTTWGCTGWLIGKDTVMTAGHCVHPGGAGKSFYPRTAFTMRAARNGTYVPSVCTATRLFSVTGWTQSGSSSYDYGAIKLNCNIGSTYGWFGYYWQSASLAGTPATVTGYPCDKGFDTMWTMSGSINTSQTYRLYYPMDTYGCQGGSPVWRVHPTYGRAGMAVHTNGGTSLNSGTRITQSVFSNMQNWKNAAK